MLRDITQDLPAIRANTPPGTPNLFQALLPCPGVFDTEVVPEMVCPGVAEGAATQQGKALGHYPPPA